MGIRARPSQTNFLKHRDNLELCRVAAAHETPRRLYRRFLPRGRSGSGERLDADESAELAGLVVELGAPDFFDFVSLTFGGSFSAFSFAGSTLSLTVPGAVL